MHILHHVQFGQAKVRLLLLQQQFRDHADHAASPGQHFIGHHSHDADHRAAIHQAQVALDEFPGQHAGLLDVLRPGAGVGTAIHADILQSHKKVGGCRSRYRMRHEAFREAVSLRKVAQDLPEAGTARDSGSGAMFGHSMFRHGR
ncbi:hypothetical protein D3C85_1232190 [compost metagenome]